MEKTQIRRFISSLTPGQNITVNFVSDSLNDARGNRLATSGTFTFRKSGVGRGKGGSLVMHLNDSANNPVCFGTPHAENILNIRADDGEMLGFTSEADMPVDYPREEQRAALFKEATKRLVGTSGLRVRVESARLPHLDGTWRVTSAKQLRGRNGQIVLYLENETGTQELWTYRHSGVVDNVSILGV